MNPELQDTIDAYLNGTMGAEARQRFESSMAEDASLAEQVAVITLEREGIEVLVESDLRSKMLRWRVEGPTGVQAQQAPRSTLTRSLLALWAGLILIVLAGFWFFFLHTTRNSAVDQQPSQQTPSAPTTPQKNKAPDESPSAPDQHKLYDPGIAQQNAPQHSMPIPSNRYLALAQSQYDRPDFTKQYRTDDSKDNGPLIKAANDLSQGNLLPAIAVLKTIAPSSVVYFQGRELLGHAYFRNRQYHLAEQIFSGLSDNRDASLSESSQWYLTLCLIAQGKTTEALPILQTIANDQEHPKVDQAKKLITQLK